MGGCASKPKDLAAEQQAPAPVEEPAKEAAATEETTVEVAEKKEGDEVKEEKPLVDLSEPEAPKAEAAAEEAEAPAVETKAVDEEKPKEEKKDSA